MPGRQDIVGNNFGTVWKGILENWEKIEGELERAEKLLKPFFITALCNQCQNNYNLAQLQRLEKE